MHNSSDPLCEMASVTMSGHGQAAGLTTDVYRQEGEELDWTTHHACHVVSAEGRDSKGISELPLIQLILPLKNQLY